MEISHFLAKFLGLYILLMSLPLLVTPKVVRQRYESFLNDEPVMTLAGIVTILVGLFLILLHNIWAIDWRLLVTLISWVILAEGISIVYFPNHARSLFRRLVQKMPMVASGCFGIVVSLYLIFMGFFQLAPAS